MSQQNKDIVIRWVGEVWNWKGNPDVIDELGAENIVFYLSVTGRLEGREQFKNAVMKYRESFPDISVHIVGDLVAEGDYVAIRWEVDGAHTGPALDLAIGSLPDATGKKIHWPGMMMYRIENGKIVEEIGQDDALTAVRQLDLVSQLAQTA